MIELIRDEFEAFLTNHLDTVFVQRNCRECPLALHLQEKYSTTRADVDSFCICVEIEGKVHVADIPDWADRFISKFDNYLDGDPTGEAGLQILDTISDDPEQEIEIRVQV